MGAVVLFLMNQEEKEADAQWAENPERMALRVIRR